MLFYEADWTATARVLAHGFAGAVPSRRYAGVAGVFAQYAAVITFLFRGHARVRRAPPWATGKYAILDGRVGVPPVGGARKCGSTWWPR